MKSIILASKSPRRKMLIGKVANCIEIISPIRDEKSTSLEPYYMVQEIARGRLRKYWRKGPIILL
jgi:Maf-like protein.